MSAAAAICEPISASPRRGWIGLPAPFYFIKADELTKTEHVILGTQLSLIRLSGKETTVIPIDRLCRAARVSRPIAYQATKELDRGSYTPYKINPAGEREYGSNMKEVRSGIIVEGQCGACGKFTSGDIVAGFIPAPYSLVFKLGAAVSSHAAWLCALVIWRETGDLDKCGGRVITKTKLDWMIVDFEEATGLSRRSIQDGLSELAALKVLKSEPNPQDARRRLYWLDLDALDKIKPRAWQSCEQPPRKPPVTSPTIESSGEIEVTSGEASVSAGVGAREYNRGEGEQKAAPEPPESSANAGNIEPTGAAKFTGRLVWARCWSCSTVAPFRETVREEPQPGTEAPPTEAPNPTPEPEPAESQMGTVATADEARRDVGFERFWLLFTEAGKPLNQRDMERARTLWNKFPLSECIKIFRWAEDQIKSGTWPNAQLTPTPANALLSEGWTRVAMERTQPARNSKREDLIAHRNEVRRMADMWDGTK